MLADDTDYSSIKIHVGDSVLGNQQIKLNVEYQLAGKKQKQKADVTLPVVEATGPTVEQLTSTVGQIPAGSAEWVDVSYKANKPGVTDGRLTATPPAGATVSYPNDGRFSGFAADSTLSVGETDHASFKIHTGTLCSGQLPGRARPGLRRRAASPRNRHPERELMRRLLVIGALAAVASSCGSGSGSGSIDPQVATAYVDAQAHALCLMQTKAFPTQAEQQAAYVHAQQNSKLTADEFAKARPRRRRTRRCGSA